MSKISTKNILKKIFKGKTETKVKKKVSKKVSKKVVKAKKVKKIPTNLKLPHVGWNEVLIKKEDRIFSNIIGSKKII